MADVSPADPFDPVVRRRGALAGLGAALLFGLSAPLAKLLLVGRIPPVLLAGLFYLGGGIGLVIQRLVVPEAHGERLHRKDVPALAGVVVLGGILGPALMMLGLARVSATAGSLLLNLEAPMTILIAIVAFGEKPTRRVFLSAAVIVAGAAALGVPAEGRLAADVLGIVFLASACAVWALDTNLMRVLSRRDPFAVSRVKTSLAGLVNVGIGLAFEPSGRLGASTLLACLAIGFVSYGLSTVLASMALRRIGAARHATFFASAPFFGALASVPLLGERPTSADVVAMLLMAVGVALLFRDPPQHPAGHGNGAANDAMVHPP